MDMDHNGGSVRYQKQKEQVTVHMLPGPVVGIAEQVLVVEEPEVLLARVQEESAVRAPHKDRAVRIEVAIWVPVALLRRTGTC